jgi:hypothetical protein
MDVIRTERKGKNLNALERHHIYKVSKANLHINDKKIDTHNSIFETIHEFYTRKQHPLHQVIL